MRRLGHAEGAFALADDSGAEALQPALKRMASLVGESRTESLSSTSLMDWSSQQGVLQMREAWETAKDWIDSVKGSGGGTGVGSTRAETRRSWPAAAGHRDSDASRARTVVARIVLGDRIK